MRIILGVLICVLGVLAGLPVVARTFSRVPADGRITLTDYGYRDWDAELLHYTVDSKVFKPGKVMLHDAAGAEIPCQLDGDVLSFVASLAKGKSATYLLSAEKPTAKLSTLRLAKNGALLEIANEFFAVRVPEVAKKTFKTSVPAASVPAPLQGWQPIGSPWRGGSRFVTERPVRGYTLSLLKNGPACIEYEARYQFAPQGEYVCNIQVSPGLDRANITEEFDFHQVTAGQDFLLLDMQKGYTPATLGTSMPAGEAKGGVITRKPLADYLAAKLKDGSNPSAPVGGAGATPMPPCPAPGMVLLEKLVAGGKWGGLTGCLELRGPAGTTETPHDRVSIVPMHTGSWRRAMALTVWQQPDAGLVTALPISVRPITWYNETTDDISPFSSHEHDSGLQPSYGRRQWALTFTATPESLQERAGYIGLDNYKEWALDWPETVKPADYPRAWYTKADVERLQKTLAQHPDRETLAKYYVFSGKTEDAIAHARMAINGVLYNMDIGAMDNWYVPGLSHYRQAQVFGVYAQAADDALACPDLPADLRQELRRTMAVMAYMMSEPDLNPRGAGVHLGNNNMTVNRTCTLAYYAALLPDHPRYRYWMDSITHFVQFMLTCYVAPDGTPLECPTYQLYGPMRFLDDAVNIIRNTGGPDYSRYVAANINYLANLTMPDSRVDGRRLIPGMGNSGNMLESIFGITLRSVEDADPALAGKMLAVHKLCWPTEPVSNLLYNQPGQALRYFTDITPQDPGLKTTFMPTYGVVFRAHFASPDETAMLFRAGTNWGHWDPDPLNTVLYGKGAPLSPGTGYQYYGGAGTDNNVIYHNQVKVGGYHQPEIFGRVDGAIQDYGFGPSADYAVASRYYPPQAFSDGKGEMSWNRHVLFLKSAQPDGPNYFVMRDTFPGGEGRPTWWTWMNLDGADKINVNGAAFDPAKTPYNKQAPDEQMPTLTGNDLEMKTKYGAGTHFWFAGDPLQMRLRMTWDYNQGGRLGMSQELFPKFAPKETKTTVEAIAKPGADYCYVVYPHKDAEAMPQCVNLGSGAVKVTTPESTDYVFVSDAPFSVNGEEVMFTGKAGAVRVFPDRVVFCMNSGSGFIGYHGHVFSGNGPFERTVKLTDLKAGMYNVNGTPEIKKLSVMVGDDVVVRGEGPSQASMEKQTIRITTDGRARVLYVTRPSWIQRPLYTVDGQAWMACWTDYPSSGWGTFKDTNLMAISVPEGHHELTLSDKPFTPGWERPFTPTIAGALAEQQAAP